MLDTGDGQQPEYFQNLKDTLSGGGSIISEVILSHWHPDHVGGISKIIETMKVCKMIIKFHFVFQVHSKNNVQPGIPCCQIS